jgi:hypothetical protein
MVNSTKDRLLAVVLLSSALAYGGIKTGPAVGTQIPEFSLKDQNGADQKLSTITGPKGAMIVFYRSADW